MKLIFSVVFPTKDFHESQIFYISGPEGISTDRTLTSPTCLLMLLIRFSVLFNRPYFVPLLMLLISKSPHLYITITFHIYSRRWMVNIQWVIQQSGRGDYLALKAHMFVINISGNKVWPAWSPQADRVYHLQTIFQIEMELFIPIDKSSWHASVDKTMGPAKLPNNCRDGYEEMLMYLWLFVRTQ